ncbi:MAG: NAD-dependent epimerase/dehydratase family protein, partial [Candidatus Binatia bacterium]
GKRENLNPKARFLEVDIRTPEIEEVVKREKPDVIDHHAAQMNVRVSVESPAFDLEVNILGTLRLLEAARQAEVRKFVFASSGGVVYGDLEDRHLPAREDAPTVPVSPYGVAKRSAEHYLEYFRIVHGLPYAALRYANIYGPRQNPHGEAGVVAVFADRILEGKAPRINGDGLQTRDYVYVGDVVEVNRKVVASPFVGPLNVGTGIETDVVTLTESLLRHSGTKLRPEHGPAKAGEQRRSVLDASLATRALGWRPAMPFDKGLGETFRWFRERFESSKKS